MFATAGYLGGGEISFSSQMNLLAINVILQLLTRFVLPRRLRVGCLGYSGGHGLLRGG